MNDKPLCIYSLFTYYDAKFLIDWWNSKLTHKGRVMVADLKGLLSIQLPYDSYLEWINPLTMDYFKLDECGHYALTLPDPKESSIW